MDSTSLAQAAECSIMVESIWFWLAMIFGGVAWVLLTCLVLELAAIGKGTAG
jgi:hypothetical protein